MSYGIIISYTKAESSGRLKVTWRENERLVIIPDTQLIRRNV